MEPISTISSAIILAIAKTVAKEISKQIIKITKNTGNSPNDIFNTQLDRHLIKVNNWSNKIELYNLSQAKNIDSSTIELDIYLTPKKLGGGDKQKIPSESLSLTERNILLLGDPGAGKTTTIKRLCQQMLKGYNKSSKKVRIPIVIRLRELGHNGSLFTVILDALGIKYRNGDRGKLEDTSRLYVASQSIENVVVDVLNSIRAFVFIDGLDELDSNLRFRIEKEASFLSFHSDQSNLLISTRSGDHDKALDGFDLYEIAPLNKFQIEKIVSKWTDNPDGFMNIVDGNPFQDTINRPLSLIHLLILYKNHGYLPEQPSAVYKKLILLYLDKWDYSRGIKRKSRYTNFYSERKLEFLASMSFRLIYKMGNSNISFTTSELLYVYENIHGNFDLPIDDGEIVIQEIESHTGIVNDIGNDRYEFSHLSIQEYLCAQYLVRNPFMEEIREYLYKRPAPIAVAVALASEPNNWISGIFLHDEFSNNSPNQIAEFLRRLYLERPYFNNSGLLGYAFIKIAFQFHTNSIVISELLNIIRLPNVKSSCQHALKAYNISDKSLPNNLVSLILMRSPLIATGLLAPKDGTLPKNILNAILNDDDLHA